MRLTIILLLVLCIVGLSYAGFFSRSQNKKTSKLAIRSKVSKSASKARTGWKSKTNRWKAAVKKPAFKKAAKKFKKIGKQWKPAFKKPAFKKAAKKFKKIGKQWKPAFKKPAFKKIAFKKPAIKKPAFKKIAKKVSNQFEKTAKKFKAILKKAAKKSVFSKIINKLKPKKNSLVSKFINKFKTKSIFKKLVKKFIKPKKSKYRQMDISKPIAFSNSPTTADLSPGGKFDVFRTRTRGFSYDAIYNFGPFFFGRRYRLGRSKESPHVTEHITLEGRNYNCGKQGVLKVSLSNTTLDKTRGRVLIDFIFRRPSDYAFNIGDSISNNGGGGDDGDQSWNAEVVGNNGNFQVYLNDEEENAKAIDLTSFYRRRTTIVISDGNVIWLSDQNDNFNFLAHDGLFALGGQFDANGNENFDLYVGVNRAIKSGTSNTGSGVCSVGIKFVPII